MVFALPSSLLPPDPTEKVGLAPRGKAKPRQCSLLLLALVFPRVFQRLVTSWLALGLALPPHQQELLKVRTV